MYNTMSAVYLYDILGDIFNKILSNMPPNCISMIEEQMVTKVKELLAEEELHKLCNLLEQSKHGRAASLSCLQEMCEAIVSLTTRVISGTTADRASISGRLWYFMKISLHIVQTFNSEVQAVLCLDVVLESPDDVTRHLKQLFNNLLTVLLQKGYATDVYVFGGTVFALLLNHVADKAASFWSIHEVLVQHGGQGHIGGLELNVPRLDHESDDTNTLAQLGFIRAVIVCCGRDSLNPTSSKIDKSSASNIAGPTLKSADFAKGDKMLLVALFPILLRYCNDRTSNQSYSFQVLSLWFSHVRKCLPLTSVDGETVSLTAKRSPYLERTLQLVFVHWDSPVRGVAESTWAMFGDVLAVWRAERDEGCTDNPVLFQDLLQRLLGKPWFVKAKYKLLVHLLPYADVNEVLSSQCWKRQLMKCMGSNDLAPLAADVYKCCLSLIRHPKDEQLSVWKEHWLDLLLAGLLSDEPMLCRKLSEYWVPVTLNVLPQSSAFLPDYVRRLISETRCPTKRHRLMHVWAVVVRVVRSTVGLDEDAFDVPMLTEAVYSSNEDVRGQVLAFLCGTVKKAELLNLTESRLLQTAIPLCLCVDSAAFRQLFASSMCKLMIRLRDGSLAAIKKKETDSLDLSLDFLHWLHVTLTQNLFPGASFQRRKTSLDILKVVYDALVYVGQSGSHKRSQADEKYVAILEYAHSKGLCNFFTWDTTVAILGCVIDGVSEVQDLSCELLLRFFPMTPPQASSHSLHHVAEHLLQTALHMCGSPRPHEAHSGALLCRILYVRFACEKGLQFESHSLDTASPYFTCTSSHSPAGKQFFELLLMRSASGLAMAQQDPSRASRESPMHGEIQAMTLCLRHGLRLSDDLLLTLTQVNVKIVRSMMAIMTKGSDAEACPSFATVGVALDSLASDGDEGSLSLTLTPEYQMMLSLCWINFKECFTCLGEVTSWLETIISTQDEEIARLKTMIGTRDEEIASVAQVFIEVLTHCRLRGALEGCRNGFLQYCTVLMHSEDEHLASIPSNILKQVMTSLESNEMLASVTRRSAGIPVIVQVIAQAEQRNQQHHLLMSTVEALFQMASAPIRSDWDQTQDIVQVHALNILNALYGDAGLVFCLLPTYARTVLLVFDGFESPSWALRNAATQLFGTMISKMFGPGSKSGSGHNMMTLQELSAHFPGLVESMLVRLTEGTVDVHHIDKLHPSLFLILTVLANLGPSESAENSLAIESEFKNKISITLHSPIFSLRELSARTLVAFVPLNLGEQEAIDLLRTLPVSLPSKLKHNFIHGTLLCLEKLLQSRDFSKEFKADILQEFLMRSWIMRLDSCALLGAKYLQIFQILVEESDYCDCDDSLKDFACSLQEHLKLDISCKLKIGSGLLAKNCVKCLVHLVKKDPSSLCKFLCEWLNSRDMDTCMACIDVLDDMVKRNTSFDGDWTYVQASLWKILKENMNTLTTTAVLRLLTDIRIQMAEHSRTLVDFTVGDLRSLMSHVDSQSSQCAASLTVEAVLLEDLFKKSAMLDDAVWGQVGEWCTRLEEASGPDQSESHRTAAAESLLIAGAAICSTIVRTKETLHGSFMESIIESTLNLLEDAEPGVRKTTTKFVCSLKWDQREIMFSDINSHTCQELLCQYMTDCLGWSSTLFRYLVGKIYKAGDVVENCKSNQFNSRIEVLFQQEVNSVLSEKPLQQVLLHSAAKSLLRKKEVSMEFNMNDLAMEVSNDLTTCLPLLAANHQGSPLLNITCDSGVFSALSGLILVSDIVLSESDGLDTAVLQAVQSGLTALFRMSHLHPWLRTHTLKFTSIHKL